MTPAIRWSKKRRQEIAANQRRHCGRPEKSQFVNQTTDRDPAFELLREDLIKTRADLAFSASDCGGSEEHSSEPASNRSTAG